MEARKAGTSFSNLLTIGRQTNYLGAASAATLKEFPDVATIPPDAVRAPYADTFFERVLGARSIDSLDISNYEGATLLHDMNEPIPASLHGRYDALIESGSLEHVFDFATAVRNCMQVVKAGGAVFLMLPVNNFVGHGFYQYSPELFFRLFSRENGFSIRSAAVGETWLLGTEHGVRLPMYRPVDPATVGKRGYLLTSYPTFLMVHAVRIGELPARLRVQQSDYQALWSLAGAPRRTPPDSRASPISLRVLALLRKLRAFAASMLPETWGLWIRAKYERIRYYSLARCVHFVPMGGSKRRMR
jgi:hypothetical protein